MKKSMFPLITTLAFVIITLLCSCLSTDQKKEDAKNRTQDAQDNLNAAQINENKVDEKVATEAELKTFKLESELKIKNNEVSIAKLRLQMNKQGSTLDDVYARRIDSLQLKNQNLRTRMGNYEKTHTDWGKFKSDFNRDLYELGKTLNNLTVEHTK
jgi:chromatin segregation and condensation protein Rec8/ScpA/Scc1 (kleisin family)